MNSIYKTLRRTIVASILVAVAGNMTAFGSDPVRADSTDVHQRDETHLLRKRSAASDILYGAPLPISAWGDAARPTFAEQGATRSIPLAFGMSGLVPGLGQAYNKDWIGLAVFVAIEAGLIIGYATSKSSGNDGVEAYELYANQNWSPVQYAEWLNAYSGYNGPDISLPSISEEELMNPDSWSAAQRAEVDAFFNEIREAERSSVYLSTGAAFSHVLPYFGEQQYYELIGKYFQYAPGWNDYTGDPDADPRDVMPDDAKFYGYAEDHAAANDKLRRASTLGALIFVNHFAAAVQAAVVAKIHNGKVQPSVSLIPTPTGELMAQARLTITL